MFSKWLDILNDLVMYESQSYKLYSRYSSRRGFKSCVFIFSIKQ